MRKLVVLTLLYGVVEWFVTRSSQRINNTNKNKRYNRKFDQVTRQKQCTISWMSGFSSATANSFFDVQQSARHMSIRLKKQYKIHGSAPSHAFID